MMDNWYKYYLVETGRRQDEIKAAEIMQMLKNDAPEIRGTMKAHQRLLIALGEMLVQWGYRIEAHYGSLPNAFRQTYSRESTS